MSGPVVELFEHTNYCWRSTCDLSRAGAVAPGGRVLGRIDYKYDMDLFRVELEAGKTYVIDVLARSSGNGTLPDPWVSGMFAIFNPNGTLDDDGLYDTSYDRMDEVWYDYDDGDHHPDRGYSDDDGGQFRDARMFLKHFPAGVYYLMVRGGSTGGTYVVAFNEAVDQETGVTNIELDTWQDASFDFPDDEDVFAVSLEAGKTYSFLAERTGWWNKDRIRYPLVTQIEEVATTTVTRLTSDLYHRQPATFTPTNDGVYHITLKQRRTYHESLRGGPYRIKVVNNLVAQGDVHWSGGRTVGEPILALPVSAGSGRVSDGNGLPNPINFSYQWYRADGYYHLADPGQVDTGINYTALPGATGQEYTPTDADEGHYLLVRVSFTDNAGNREHLYGGPYKRVRAVPAPSDGDESSSESRSEPDESPPAEIKLLSVVHSLEPPPASALARAAEEPEEIVPSAPLAPENLVVDSKNSLERELVLG